MPAEPDRLDTRIAIVTPENIAFEHRVAGPFRRLPAYVIDLMIATGVVTLVFVAALLAFSVIGAEGIGIGLGFVVYFVVGFFYHGLFEALWNGQTPGKWMLGLRVVTIDGLPIHPWQAILRNLLRAADALPYVPLGTTETAPVFFTYLAGLVSAASNHRFQRLGDLVCGTMVVIEQSETRFGVTRVDDPPVLKLAESLPRGFRGTRSLAAVVSSYVARRVSFTRRQREELARHAAEPLRVRFELPENTSYDLLLCAVYHRLFISEPMGESSELLAEPRATPQPRIVQAEPASAVPIP